MVFGVTLTLDKRRRPTQAREDGDPLGLEPRLRLTGRIEPRSESRARPRQDVISTIIPSRTIGVGARKANRRRGASSTNPSRIAVQRLMRRIASTQK